MEAETAPTTEKIKRARTLTPEHRAKLNAGRERAAEARKARAAAAPARGNPDPRHVSEPRSPASVPRVVPHEFTGLSRADCPVDCTPNRCAIGGSLVINNADGTKTLVGHCCHPLKAGLGPIHKTKPEIVERYNRARKYLAHMELDRKP